VVKYRIKKQKTDHFIPLQPPQPGVDIFENQRLFST